MEMGKLYLGSHNIKKEKNLNPLFNRKTISWGIIVLISLFPSPAMAFEQGSLRLTRIDATTFQVEASDPFVLPPQIGGLEAVPQPWYKKGWVWTIALGLVAGAAAAGGGEGGGSGAAGAAPGSATIELPSP
jgi:hypothetical protein